MTQVSARRPALDAEVEDDGSQPVIIDGFQPLRVDGFQPLRQGNCLIGLQAFMENSDIVNGWMMPNTNPALGNYRTQIVKRDNRRAFAALFGPHQDVWVGTGDVGGRHLIWQATWQRRGAPAPAERRFWLFASQRHGTSIAVEVPDPGDDSPLLDVRRRPVEEHRDIRDFLDDLFRLLHGVQSEETPGGWTPPPEAVSASF